MTSTQAQADAAPKVTSEQLSAHQWFEQGYAADKLTDKIKYYSEAIRLNPEFADAYPNRGRTLTEFGNHKRAKADTGMTEKLKSGLVRR